MNSHLIKLGWNDFFQNSFNSLNTQALTPARIIRENRGQYIVSDGVSEFAAQLTGHARNQTLDPADYPTVGDWVCFEQSAKQDVQSIQALLPRKTKIERQASGTESRHQLIAANIDSLFLVSGLDGDFNLNRIQRYLTLAGNSGAQPVIILNKSDLVTDLENIMKSVEKIAYGVPVHTVSALDEESLTPIRSYVQPGRTIAMLGSSGVGKSTLINALMGEAKLLTQSNRDADSRGRHTTTWRELIQMSNGGLLIDLPGMRELQLTGDDAGLKQTFEDIESIAKNCRFRDCQHQGEPGCAIESAIENGSIDLDRYTQYQKLKRETSIARSRRTVRLRKNKKTNQARQDKEDYFKSVQTTYRKNKNADEKWRQKNDMF